MSDIAIRVEGLGKQYRIGKRERYRTLRDTLADAARAPFRRLRSALGLRSAACPEGERTIWALQDVSFEIPRGEVVGVIGRNGAGKSTLLKVLSRITEPTAGRIEIKGRVGSLLEVGTGFHPELTGRENVFLNGAILGMRRTEITRKFDEIVAFAEIEKFIDTPVKHYSSGMYMRLAFSVSAHLDPEILVVDEVLAVGDAAFQKKCLGKMGDVAREGRTVLLVSHNLIAIRHLCSSALLFQSGRMVHSGEPASVLSRYQDAWVERSGANLEIGVLYNAIPDASRPFQIVRIEMLDVEDRAKAQLFTWDYVKFRIYYQARLSEPNFSVEIRISAFDGYAVMSSSTRPDHDLNVVASIGTHCVECEFPRWPFAAGRFSLAAALAVPMRMWLTPLEDLAVLDVQPLNVYQSRSVVPTISRTLVAVPHEWRVGTVSSQGSETTFATGVSRSIN